MNQTTTSIPQSIERLSANELEKLVNTKAIDKDVAIALLERRAAARIARGKKESWPSRHVIARLKGLPTPTDIRNQEKAKAGVTETKPSPKAKTTEAPAKPTDYAAQIAKLEAMLAKLRQRGSEAALVTKPRTTTRRRTTKR